jgi:hypothetical protein
MAVRFHIVPTRYHIGLHSPVDRGHLSVDLRLMFSQYGSFINAVAPADLADFSSEGSPQTKDGCLLKCGKSSGGECYVIMSKAHG